MRFRLLRTFVFGNAVSSFGRPYRHLHAGAKVQLLEKVLHVNFHGAVRDIESLTDVVVRKARSNATEHVEFS